MLLKSGMKTPVIDTLSKVAVTGPEVLLVRLPVDVYVLRHAHDHAIAPWLQVTTSCDYIR